MNDRPVDERLQTPQVVDMAEEMARYLLRERPERMQHSEAVAERAKFLTVAVAPEEAPVLVAAAWLHDIGYTAELHRTGFHPLDGALHLRGLGWPDLVADLVAHHSGARFVASVRDLETDLAAFTYVEDRISDALTVADQTAGPGGRPMTLHVRMQDMLTRHGAASPNARAHEQREPYLVGAATRVALRLEEVGIGPSRHRIL